MRQVLINIYRYEELSESAKVKAFSLVSEIIESSLNISEMIDLDSILKENQIICEDYEIMNLDQHTGYTDIYIENGTYKGLPIKKNLLYEKDSFVEEILKGTTAEMRLKTLKIGESLRKVYEKELSEENVLRFINENDFWFTQNGEVFYDE